MIRRNGRPIHANVPRPSDPDTIALSRAVEERFLRLCKSWLKIRGEEMLIPPDMDGDLLRWRSMCVRHRKGDFRHTEAESKSLRTVAQWTLDMNCVLRNQPLIKLVWGD